MKTVVIGGGLSGLATAFGLLQRGQDVVLLEAGPDVGGTIRTSNEGGFLTESGPNGWLDKEPAMRRLIDALGLSAKVRPATGLAKERFVFWGGRLRKLPAKPTELLRSNLLPWHAKLRAAGELFTRRARPGLDESLASFGRRHLGNTVTALLIDAMQSGIFAGDVERLSLAAVFPRMAELEREHRSLILAMIRLQRERRRAQQAAPEPSGPSGVLSSLEGGLQALVAALEARLESRVRTGARVTALARTANRWTVGLGAESLSTDRLVLATPAFVAAPLLSAIDPPLSDELAAIPYAPVAAVHVGFEREAIPSHSGFGFLIPEREGRRILGTLFISSIFPWRAPEGRALFTVMVGGARHPDRVKLGDPELLTLVREELAATLGIVAEPLYTRIVRWDRGIPQYEVGHLARIERIEQRLATLPGLSLVGNAYRGVGMNDCVREAGRLVERLTASAA